MNSCLVIVDYQNDFVNGSLGFNEAKKFEKNIVLYDFLQLNYTMKAPTGQPFSGCPVVFFSS